MDLSEFVPLLVERGKDPKKAVKIAAEKRVMAKTLIASGRSYREVAEVLDISVGSVHNIMKEAQENIMRILTETRARHAMKCLLLSDHILGRISDYDIANASLREKIIASAILADKAEKSEKKDAGAGSAAGGTKEKNARGPAGEETVERI